MARIQILELPTEHHGEDTVTPFVVILDQVKTMGALVDFKDAAAKLGARAVLAFEETVEVPANATGPS